MIQAETCSNVNSISLICSAHLRAVASGSLWTLTCAHMCVFTLETAHMYAPLTAATKNLPSQPTWSLTSSHTPKPKTTSEKTMWAYTGGLDLYLCSLTDKLVSRGLLCCEIRSPLCIISRWKAFEKRPFLRLFDKLMEVWTMNSWEPRPPQASYPPLALPGWNNLCFLLVKMLIHGSTPKMYLYLHTAS